VQGGATGMTVRGNYLAFGSAKAGSDEKRAGRIGREAPHNIPIVIDAGRELSYVIISSIY